MMPRDTFRYGIGSSVPISQHPIEVLQAEVLFPFAHFFWRFERHVHRASNAVVGTGFVKGVASAVNGEKRRWDMQRQLHGGGFVLREQMDRALLSQVCPPVADLALFTAGIPQIVFA